jgi:hypothetical protein
MKGLKGSVVLVVTILSCAALASAQTPRQDSVSPRAEQKRIGFTLVKNVGKKSPTANATIFFAYYDPGRSDWQKSSRRTDARGKCSFLVPKGKGGESYTFLFATAQDALADAIRNANGGEGMAWRIPPGEQEDLELLTDGTSQSNTKGSVQMWSLGR